MLGVVLMQAAPSDIKAIFFDIDGTLISFNTHSMPVSTQRALHTLREKGIRLFVATGRAPIMMPFLDKYFQFDAYLTLNGQYCYTSEGVIRKQTIDSGDIRKLKALIRKHHFPCLFVHEKGGSLNFIDERVRELYRMINYPLPEPQDLEDFPEDQVLQFVVFTPGEVVERIRQALPRVKLTRFMQTCFDAIPVGGGKDMGIQAVMDYTHIKQSETMAFGDGHNDIAMLQFARIGVAMGSSDDEVKEAADYVTGSADEDGIAKALHHFGVLP